MALLQELGGDEDHTFGWVGFPTLLAETAQEATLFWLPSRPLRPSVQLYERELDLPIRRLAEKSSDAVIAIKVEIDSWINATPRQTGSARKPMLSVRIEKVRADFLLVDRMEEAAGDGLIIQISYAALLSTATARATFRRVAANVSRMSPSGIIQNL